MLTAHYACDIERAAIVQHMTAFFRVAEAYIHCWLWINWHCHHHRDLLPLASVGC